MRYISSYIMPIVIIAKGVRTHTRTRTHARTHTHTHTHAPAHTHTRTHTHTKSAQKQFLETRHAWPAWFNKIRAANMKNMKSPKYSI